MQTLENSNAAPAGQPGALDLAPCSAGYPIDPIDECVRLGRELAELRRQHAATVADYEYQRSLRAEMREHVVKLLPYAHMLMRGEKPISAYADSLPYIIADAEAATRGPNKADLPSGP